MEINPKDFIQGYLRAVADMLRLTPTFAIVTNEEMTIEVTGMDSDDDKCMAYLLQNIYRTSNNDITAGVTNNSNIIIYDWKVRFV